jgi:hypothetical protein
VLANLAGDVLPSAAMDRTRRHRIPARLRWCHGALALLVVFCMRVPVATAYSLLPLVTEEAETLPDGTAEAILGVNFVKDLRFPPFTPPGVLHSLVLIGLPQFGFRIAAGNWAEIQGSYEVLYLNEKTTNGYTNWQYGSGDLRVSTKVWITREHDRFPALGLRFGTKIPNANRDAQLGTDDTDFWADGLFSKDFGPLSLHSNLGILLLGNSGSPISNVYQAGGQDDLFSYSTAVVSAPMGAPAPGATQLRLLGEVAGQTGSHYANDRSVVRVGLQLAEGAGTVFLGVSTGLDTASETIGASLGFIYTFEPAKLLKMD